MSTNEAYEAGRMACRLGLSSCSYPMFEGNHAALRDAWLRGWGDEFKERT